MSPPRTAPVLALRIQCATADPERPALIDADDPSRTLSHNQLAARVAEAAASLPRVTNGRCLVHVPLTADVDTVIGYLSVLLAGHVALVTDPHGDAIAAHYRPDLVLGPGNRFTSVSAAPQHVLHPDLAVLLSTSGSTGSPKLVRLSRDNVLSNADAIVSALAITAADIAITLLPLHYCFGLSVLHTQLRAGATVVLRARSAADPDVGDVLARHRVSILPATPHVVDLLDVQGVLQRDLPDLRLVTQAGGALAPDRVADVAARGRAGGWSLVVMYGQTEATARMAVLPLELVSQHTDAVGWPIANSSFRLDTTVPGATTGVDPVGELVFSGPGVMLGYAEDADDLALGRMVEGLRTGDLARIRDDGLVRIVGRRADFVKIMGLRIDFGQVERRLRAHGVHACVTAADDQLQVTYQAADAPVRQQVRELASSVAGLGTSIISVQAVETLPRLSNGKIDRASCAAGHGRRRPAPIGSRLRQPADLAAVVAVLAPLTSRGTVDPDRSFVELGGDSFSHVQASLRLGRLLGDLPADWHHRPLRELPQVAQPSSARPFGQQVEISVLLRAVAVIMICGSHVGLFPLAGGAHILLAVAGFSYGRYVVSEPASGQRWRRTARATLGLTVPTVVVALAMLAIFRGAHWSNVVLLHWAVRPDLGNIFWFVEALLVNMVALTAVLSVGPLRAAYARDPWRVAFLLTVVLLVPRYAVLALADGPIRGLPWTVGWLFTAGIAMATARTTPRRVLTAAVAVGATVGFFPAAERNLVIMAGLGLLALLPAVVVPRAVVRPVEVVAAASLHVYLVQFQMFAFFPSPALKFGAALAAGLLFWWVSAGLVRRLQELVPLVVATRKPPVSHPQQRRNLLWADAPS